MKLTVASILLSLALAPAAIYATEAEAEAESDHALRGLGRKKNRKKKGGYKKAYSNPCDFIVNPIPEGWAEQQFAAESYGAITKQNCNLASILNYHEQKEVEHVIEEALYSKYPPVFLGDPAFWIGGIECGELRNRRELETDERELYKNKKKYGHKYKPYPTTPAGTGTPPWSTGTPPWSTGTPPWSTGTPPWSSTATGSATTTLPAPDFCWVDGEYFNFANWAYQQPDGGSGEIYIELFSKRSSFGAFGEWNDENDNLVNGFNPQPAVFKCCPYSNDKNGYY